MGGRKMYNLGANPAPMCGKYRRHAPLCSGRHKKAFGVLGRLCTCECHKDENRPVTKK